MFAHRFFKAVVTTGELTVIDAKGKRATYGDGEGPPATIRITNRWTELRMLLNPTLHVGEAYMDGHLVLEQGSIYDFLDIASRNIRNVGNHPLRRWIRRIAVPLRHLRTFNPISRARRNVAHHYDLSGELYDLFLDDDRQYSCAYFTSEQDTLEQAQTNKKRHIAAKLLLDKPGLNILDIGSGWGGMGLYLAREADAKVTGVTLSEEQLKISRARAEKEGLAERTEFHLRDYREEPGTYDRIVSVGMFEHVGSSHYHEFFRKVKSVLAEDGVMLLHAIGTMGPPGPTNPWLRKYIFPGGYTPSLSEVTAAIEDVGLYITDIEILRLHYAETLRHWRERFEANIDRARTLYDDRFCRMWDFYLAGCEVSFRYMDQMVFQIQLAHKQEAVPLTRDYITDWERGTAQKSTRAAE
ncbi:MAG: cyclopropane-fatty-acyl-phospholipid synthase family protein [Rhodovibrionaceae bacterium]